MNTLSRLVLSALASALCVVPLTSGAVANAQSTEDGDASNVASEAQVVSSFPVQGNLDDFDADLYRTCFGATQIFRMYSQTTLQSNDAPRVNYTYFINNEASPDWAIDGRGTNYSSVSGLVRSGDCPVFGNSPNLTDGNTTRPFRFDPLRVDQDNTSAGFPLGAYSLERLQSVYIRDDQTVRLTGGQTTNPNNRVEVVDLPGVELIQYRYHNPTTGLDPGEWRIAMFQVGEGLVGSKLRVYANTGTDCVVMDGVTGEVRDLGTYNVPYADFRDTPGLYPPVGP